MAKKHRRAELPPLVDRLRELVETYRLRGHREEAEQLRAFVADLASRGSGETAERSAPDRDWSAATAWQRCRKILISAFVIFHCTAVGIWLCPPSTFRSMVISPFYYYLTFLGLWQNWTVFAPVPKKWNVFLTAEITYADGSEEIWPFPRMDKLGLLEKAQKERYRKWANESVYDFKNRKVWPDTARYIARLRARTGKVPAYVSLIRHWAYIPPPPDGLGKPSPEPTEQYTFFTYKVKAEDLK